MFDGLIPESPLREHYLKLGHIEWPEDEREWVIIGPAPEFAVTFYSSPKEAVNQAREAYDQEYFLLANKYDDDGLSPAFGSSGGNGDTGRSWLP